MGRMNAMDDGWRKLELAVPISLSYSLSSRSLFIHFLLSFALPSCGATR